MQLFAGRNAADMPGKDPGFKAKKPKIKIKNNRKSDICIKIFFISLLILTVYAFWSFDYKDLQFSEAVSKTFTNLKSMFLEPACERISISEALKQTGITLALSFLTTLIGAFAALFLSFFTAENLFNKTVSKIIKGISAFVRAVPTVLWVLIFAVTAGLGSEAAVIGMTFHTIGYLIKVYSESFEEIEEGTIEALKAGGAGWWQIIFQAVIPSSVNYIISWTFMRFEINFTNAVSMGAAAGAGGIGFELFMSSNFYFNVHEVGFITIFILICAVILETVSSKIKIKCAG